MNLLSSTAVFSFFTLISRILGYIRDVLIAIFLGASIYADAFFVAFRLPNTFRRLFAEGTFNAAFIPSYTSSKINGKSIGENFANEVLTLITIILFFIVLLVEIFTPVVVYLIAPGFITDFNKYNLAIELTRITFPFLFFVSISSLFSGILNSHNKFAAAAAAPIFLNLILIISIFFSFYLNLDYAKNMSYGVTISGLVQLSFLIYFTKNYYKPKVFLRKKISKKVKFFIRKLIPSVFSSGVTQINILIGTIIASFQMGAVSYLYYADRIYQINLAIAGIAVGTVSLPALSKAFKNKNYLGISKIQSKSIELSMLLSLPAAAGIIIGSEEIVSSLFGYGTFNEKDVYMTANALKYFGYGVPAFALVKVLSNLFFARNNTKLPFYISTIIVFMNIVISISFFKDVGFIIIPIATSISTWAGVIIYYIQLLKMKYFKLDHKLIFSLMKIILSTFFMSLVYKYSLDYFSIKLDYSNTFKFPWLLIIITIVTCLYLSISYFFGILKFRSFKT